MILKSVSEALPKINDSANRSPLPTDNRAHGYSVGSRWIVSHSEYVCVEIDPTTGAAVWVETTRVGDVVGPVSAVDGNFTVFDGTTGKAIKDGGNVIEGGTW